MIHRFAIPRYVWWFVALVTICIGGTFALWSAHVWTPVQRHYLWAYVWCSRPGAAPSSQITLRWFYKTAPGRQSELASEDDTVSGPAYSHTGLAMTLSPTARQTGWTGLMLGPKDQISIAALKPFLKEQFFDGNNAWMVVSLPLLCGMAVFCFLILGAAWLESRLHYVRWQMEQTSWLKPMQFRLRKWLTATAKLYSRSMKLATRRTWKVTPENRPIAAPIASSAKPVQPAFLPFGATNGIQKPGFTWSKKDEIE